MDEIKVYSYVKLVSVVIAVAAFIFIIYAMNRPHDEIQNFKDYLKTNPSNPKNAQLLIPKGIDQKCFANCYVYWKNFETVDDQKMVENFYDSKWFDYCVQACK